MKLNYNKCRNPDYNIRATKWVGMFVNGGAQHLTNWHLVARRQLIKGVYCLWLVATSAEQ